MQSFFFYKKSQWIFVGSRLQRNQWNIGTYWSILQNCCSVSNAWSEQSMTASRFSPNSFASCTTSLIISSRECVVTCTTTEVTLTLKQKLEADEKPFGNASIQTHAWTQDGRTIQKHDASVAQKTYNADTTTFRCNSNSNRPFIPLHFLCTHFWQLVHCNELLPTSLQQTPHGNLTAFCLTFWRLRCGSKLIVAVSTNNSGLS